MRIAILSQYFDPEPAIKLTALVPRLVSDGHEVEVLTSLPNLPHGKLYRGYRSTALIRDDRLGAKVFRAFVWPYRGRTVWKRVLHLATFALSGCILLLATKGLRSPVRVPPTANDFDSRLNPFRARRGQCCTTFRIFGPRPPCGWRHSARSALPANE